MKIRLVTVASTVVFLLSGCVSASGPQANNAVNIYQYTQAPDVFFFPKAQAKWDGYKITNKDWNRLNDYQKFMFILEGKMELERNEKVIITMSDSARTLVALNYGVDKMNKEISKTQVSMLSFMYDVLKIAKMVAPLESKVTKKNKL